MKKILIKISCIVLAIGTILLNIYLNDKLNNIEENTSTATFLSIDE